MDIEILQTFLTAAKTENFRETAEQLFISQPTVTVQMKQLEKELRVKLFEKRGRHIFLTEAGVQFLPFAKRMIHSYDLALDQMNLWKSGKVHHLKLGVTPQIAESTLPTFLKTFLAKHQDWDISIEIITSPNMKSALANYQIDIGLSRLNLSSPYHANIIYEDPMVLVMPAYLHGEQLEDILAKYPLIIQQTTDEMEKIYQQLFFKYPFIKTMLVNQFSIAKRFVEEGLGVSFLPLSMVKNTNHSLITIMPFENLPTTPIYAVFKIQTKKIDYFSHALQLFYE